MNGGILTINVGGTVFQIWSYGTAMKKVDTVEVAYSELGLLLRPDRPMNHRSKIGFELQRGSFFIDRDGTYFRFVLDYLRGILSEKNKKQFTDEILEEAKFYGLKELEDEMKKYTVCTLLAFLVNNGHEKLHQGNLSVSFTSRLAITTNFSFPYRNPRIAQPQR